MSALSVLLSFGFAFLTLYPAMNAAKLNPIDALRANRGGARTDLWGMDTLPRPENGRLIL